MRLRVYLPETTLDWDSPTATFRVGRGDTTALRFEGESAKFASWEHAEFSEGHGGASVTDLASSNGTYVDGARIAAPTALRVGTVVQIGRAGPRLEVLALAPTAGRPVPLAAAPAPLVSSPPAGSPALRTPAGESGSNWPPRAVAGALAGMAVLAVIVAVALTRQGLRNDKPVAEATGGGKTKAKDTRVQGTKAQGTKARDTKAQGTKKARPANDKRAKKADPPEAGGGAASPPLADADPGPRRDPVPEPDPRRDAIERGIAAYRLIVVEDPQTQVAWPHAGAMVVGERTLLTSAAVAVDLQRFRDRDWIVSVMKLPQGGRAGVKRLRVHAAYQAADAADQPYFDVALLDCKEPLGAAISLAAPAEIERGQPLDCIAVEHSGDPLDRFQSLNPEGHGGKVFAVTSLPPPPDGPRLLHLRGTFSEKFLGSALVNEAGDVVAVYCGAAAEAAAGGPLQYATVIDRKMIEIGLNEKDNPLWVVPAAAPSDTP